MRRGYETVFRVGGGSRARWGTQAHEHAGRPAATARTRAQRPCLDARAHLGVGAGHLALQAVVDGHAGQRARQPRVLVCGHAPAAARVARQEQPVLVHASGAGHQRPVVVAHARARGVVVWRAQCCGRLCGYSRAASGSSSVHSRRHRHALATTHTPDRHKQARARAPDVLLEGRLQAQRLLLALVGVQQLHVQLAALLRGQLRALRRRHAPAGLLLAALGLAAAELDEAVCAVLAAAGHALDKRKPGVAAPAARAAPRCVGRVGARGHLRQDALCARSTTTPALALACARRARHTRPPTHL